MDTKKEIYIDPRILEHDFNFPFWIDNIKLWALDVPVEEIDIKELLWIFDFPFWEDSEDNLTITPNEVINDPDKYKLHAEKIKSADTSYPLDIMKNKKGAWLTLDGLHRLVKLALRKETIIKVRKIPPELIPLVAKEK